MKTKPESIFIVRDQRSVAVILTKDYAAKAVVPETELGAEPSNGTTRYWMQAEDGLWYYVLATATSILVNLKKEYKGPTAQDAYWEREYDFAEADLTAAIANKTKLAEKLEQVGKAWKAWTNK